MASAGIDTAYFRPHSVCSASTSVAKMSMSVKEIIEHVGWMTNQIFRHHYDMPIVKNKNFARAVLDSSLGGGTARPPVPESDDSSDFSV